MQKLLTVIAVLVSFSASAQSMSPQTSPSRDSDVVRQYSVGFNARRLWSGYNTSEPAPIGFIQYRVGNSAVRIGISTVASYLNNERGNTFPNKISITDSTIVIGEKYRMTSGVGGSVEYLRYLDMTASKAVQVYGGIGLYGGSLDDQTGYNYTMYTKDSLGVFNYNDKISSNTEVDRFASSRGFQLGAVPVFGVVLAPLRTLSVALEARVPFLYDQTKAYDKTNTTSGFGMSTQFAVNVTLSLDAR